MNNCVLYWLLYINCITNTITLKQTESSCSITVLWDWSYIITTHVDVQEFNLYILSLLYFLYIGKVSTTNWHLLAYWKGTYWNNYSTHIIGFSRKNRSSIGPRLRQGTNVSGWPKGAQREWPELWKPIDWWMESVYSACLSWHDSYIQLHWPSSSFPIGN